MAGPVEALTVDLGGDDGRTVALVELGDVELDGDADELAEQVPAIKFSPLLISGFGARVLAAHISPAHSAGLGFRM